MFKLITTISIYPVWYLACCLMSESKLISLAGMVYMLFSSCANSASESHLVQKSVNTLRLEPRPMCSACVCVHACVCTFAKSIALSKHLSGRFHHRAVVMVLSFELWDWRPTCLGDSWLGAITLAAMFTLEWHISFLGGFSHCEVCFHTIKFSFDQYTEVKGYWFVF